MIPAFSRPPAGWPRGRSGGPWLLAIFGGAALAFGLLSLANHAYLRTNAYDLGVYNHALWDYAHLRVNANSIMRLDNLLGDHFTGLQLIIAPLWWVFGEWTLLVVQLVAVLLGGWGAWRLHTARLTMQAPGASRAPARWLTLHFFGMWGLWSALAFDYHDNVVGAMVLPWLLLAFLKRRGARAAGCAALMLLAKENMALWLICIGLGLAWLYWSDPRRRTWGLALSAVAAGYFVLITNVVMPAFSTSGHYIYAQHYYGGLGNTFGEIAHTLLTRPFFALSLLWRNFPYDAGAAGVKAELHLMVLLAGGLVLLRYPAYGLMLASIYAQKLLSSRPVLWGISYQYSVEFVPVLNAALGHWLLTGPASAARRPWVTYWAAGLATVAIVSTQVSIKHRYSPSPDAAQSRWLSRRHYTRGFDAFAVRRALAVVPPGVPVSAQSALVPHLTARPTCYLYPFVGEAEYLVLLPNEEPYPLTRPSFDRTLARLRRSGAWTEVAQPAAPALVVLRRRHPLTSPPYPRRRYAAGPVPLADSLQLEELTEPTFRKGL